MRLIPCARVLPALFLLTVWVFSPPVAAQGRPPQGRYVVVLSQDAGPPAQVAADVARRTGGRVGYVYEQALRGFSITMPPAALAGIARDPRVAHVDEDIRVTAFDQTTPTGVQRIFASQSNPDIGGGADSRVDADVAVLDTGIDRQHPDLNVVGGTNCLATTGGGPPWSRSYFCDDSQDGDDDHYHGTHVAGTIGALDNGFGVVGVAPGVRLWAVKVLDSQGSGYLSGIIAGIDWVVARGDIEVINMSLGGSGTSTAMNDAIQNAVDNDVVVVVAAGNDDADASGYTPANAPAAITVSALADFDGLPGGGAAPTCRTDQDDTLADFSNWGSTVDIAAPGVCIYSTLPLEQGGYGTLSGTSMATPHVAGAAALLASHGDTATQIRTALVSNGNLDWTDDSGDAVQEPLLDVSASVFAPVLVAAGGGGTGTSSPVASFSTVCNNLLCNFDAGSSTDAGGTITQYDWDFGDGNSGTGATVSHSYSAGGTYTVTLTVTDDGGAKGTTQQGVTVTDGSSLLTSSVNNGKTWTAIVQASDPMTDLTGTWTYPGVTVACTGGSNECTLSGIPKKEASVQFESGSGDIVTVLKP